MTQNDGIQAVRETEAAVEAFLAGQTDDSRRVTLRPLAAGDQSEFLDLVNTSAELHHPWMSLPSTPREFQTYLARYEQPGEESLLVCLRSTGAIAGMVNINSIIRGRFQNGSLGYAAFAPTAGQGYMSEGLDLVVRYAFEQLRLHRLEAQIQPGNHASLKLIRRSGFHQEGYSPELLFIDGAWRDHERWALISTMVDIAPTAPHPTLPER
ncbi:GNAT family N-acetyltransferase [Streptosporangium lutulentum]|uniref:Ribosomal-protein-alanine N-acetyltransferase n=1 Tax=Streptosporangium lutulentum TaxID=1461250 RepID=A0ABT9QLM4_9ACTN|nr:GNAT family N-acetyltransferase [Streptosporangium lutulentum]MDP9847667.1 ribosomal-protein-alanine N-acetyltransferase [Streptosporangium lutulentum]